jgi:hypothetical protein
MDIKTLKDMAPWDWPQNAGEMIYEVLLDDQVDVSDRLLAAQLAGDSTVVNDELADTLLSILCADRESDELRGRAAIALGPALEMADMDGFDDADDVPITEEMFGKIQETLHQLHMDAHVPKEVRRRVLEASVRAPQDWHQDAVRVAYAVDDEDWKLTAVFCMQYIRGFGKQILESLESENPDIHYQAVCAAGNWEIDAAWPHVAGLVTSENTDKDLLIAAIGSAVLIRPHEASDLLGDLLDSDDEDIADAVDEALAMTGAFYDEEDDEDDDRGLLH